MFGHRKILHTLIGMGSAAPAAAVPYPGKVTRISSKGLKKIKINKKREENRLAPLTGLTQL